MQHRLNVLKANTFEACVFLLVTLASLGLALVVMTVLMPFSQLAALLVALPAGYWTQAGLFSLTDRAAADIRLRLHRAAHCTDCTPAVQSDQYYLKATGERVTLLEHLGGGDVRIAMDTAHTLRDDIVNARDITPAALRD
ncbi:hypothetical protein AB0K87_11165 [Streptomyces sp. NPDC053705]|uniref:hypothetical protein n=1 Tax=Streptomyces sp. NPDC053705 TaxID=3156668 RepID=UPI00341E96A7